MIRPSIRFLAAAIGCAALLLNACSDSAASDEVPEPTDSAAPVSAAAETADYSAISSVVQEYLEEHELNGAGLVVVQTENGIVHEEYWGEFSADRVSLIASASKVLSAGVLLRLQDDGVLDLDAPIADQLGWDGDSPVTAAQLISNSSGLVGLLPDPTYAPYLCQYLDTGSANLQECGETILNTEADDADVVLPDTEFRYGGGQWQVAGAVAEAASGRSWAELIDEIYVEPCEVDSLAYNNHFTQLSSDEPFFYPPGFDGDPAVLKPTENPNIEAGAYITAPDYAALLLMHLRGGTCGDNRVLSQEALDVMHADRILAAYEGNTGFEGDGAAGSGYGMGWWIDRESGVIQDPGAYGAVPWLDLHAGYGAYLVIEATSDQGIELSAKIQELVQEAAATG